MKEIKYHALRYNYNLDVTIIVPDDTIIAEYYNSNKISYYIGCFKKNSNYNLFYNIDYIEINNYIIFSIYNAKILDNSVLSDLEFVSNKIKDYISGTFLVCFNRNLMIQHIIRLTGNVRCLSSRLELEGVFIKFYNSIDINKKDFTIQINYFPSNYFKEIGTQLVDHYYMTKSPIVKSFFYYTINKLLNTMKEDNVTELNDYEESIEKELLNPEVYKEVIKYRSKN